MKMTDAQYRMATRLGREPRGRAWVANVPTARVLARLGVVTMGTVRDRYNRAEITLTALGRRLFARRPGQ
jgi:hypothetical protein